MSVLRNATTFWRENPPPMPFMVAVVGPTATGKTALAKQIAQELNGYCISADSRQIYKGMEIGTNAELVDLPHAKGFGVGIVEPHESYSVAQFQSDAVDFMCLPENRGKIPVIVGGTGQWVQALTEGWIFPTVPPQSALRDQLQQEYEQDGLEPLVERLRSQLPWAERSVDLQNPRRVMRALERSLCRIPRVDGLISVGLPVPVMTIGLDLPDDLLYRTVDIRIQDMLRKEWQEEVRWLMRRYPHITNSLVRGCPVPDAFRSIGYRDLIEHELDSSSGSLSLVKEHILSSTKKYIRRQRTWWRRHPQVRWVSSVEEGLRCVHTHYLNR